MSLEDFELYVISKGLKLEDIDEQLINEYFTSYFYDIETEEDLEALNNVEKELRKIYLGE